MPPIDFYNKYDSRTHPHAHQTLTFTSKLVLTGARCSYKQQAAEVLQPRGRFIGWWIDDCHGDRFALAAFTPTWLARTPHVTKQCLLRCWWHP